MKKSKVIFAAYKQGGVVMALAHFFGRLFGISKFLRPASTIDFKKFQLKSAKSSKEFLSLLTSNHKDIDFALDKAHKLINKSFSIDTEKFTEPKNWNSGIELQYILFSLIILTKPEVIVETGTANGASTAAIIKGLEFNHFGHLWSFDIKPANPVLVSEKLKEFVTFVKVSGRENDLEKHIQSLKKSKNGFSLFLHDSDHSYLGQQSDFRVAYKNNFDIILSDDIDASLAFCEFAKAKGVTLYDLPKFIGAVRYSDL